MTNSHSIQDVIFFPQMKPERGAPDPSEAFKTAGIRVELIPVLQELGISSLDQLKSSAPNKLFNDVCGMRKKMKLKEVKNPTLDEVKAWIKST